MTQNKQRPRLEAGTAKLISDGLAMYERELAEVRRVWPKAYCGGKDVMGVMVVWPCTSASWLG